MRYVFTLVLAVALFAGSLISFSYAQAINDKTVRIVFVSPNDLSSSSGTILPTITRGMQDSAQAELSSNPELKNHLEKHNVQIGNVVKIDRAANGDRIVYVK